MKRVHERQLFKWMQKYPIFGRAFALVVLVLFPLIVIPIVLWEERENIVDCLSESFAVAFLPWEDRK